MSPYTKKLLSGAVAVCLASLAVALPTTHRSSAQAVIFNGTSVTIDYMDNAFVYCSAQVSNELYRYQVEWRGPTGATVHRWSPGNSNVFSLDSTNHVPHSYLVFHTFLGVFADDYTCVLLYDNSEIRSTAVISVLAR